MKKIWNYILSIMIAMLLSLIFSLDAHAYVAPINEDGISPDVVSTSIPHTHSGSSSSGGGCYGSRHEERRQGTRTYARTITGCCTAGDYAWQHGSKCPHGQTFQKAYDDEIIVYWTLTCGLNATDGTLKITRQEDTLDATVEGATRISGKTFTWYCYDNDVLTETKTGASVPREHESYTLELKYTESPGAGGTVKIENYKDGLVIQAKEPSTTLVSGDTYDLQFKTVAYEDIRLEVYKANIVNGTVRGWTKLQDDRDTLYTTKEGKNTADEYFTLPLNGAKTAVTNDIYGVIDENIKNPASAKHSGNFTTAITLPVEYQKFETYNEDGDLLEKHDTNVYKYVATISAKYGEKIKEKSAETIITYKPIDISEITVERHFRDNMDPQYKDVWNVGPLEKGGDKLAFTDDYFHVYAKTNSIHGRETIELTHPEYDTADVYVKTYDTLKMLHFHPECDEEEDTRQYDIGPNLEWNTHETLTDPVHMGIPYDENCKIEFYNPDRINEGDSYKNVDNVNFVDYTYTWTDIMAPRLFDTPMSMEGLKVSTAGTTQEVVIEVHAEDNTGDDELKVSIVGEDENGNEINASYEGTDMKSFPILANNTYTITLPDNGVYTVTVMDLNGNTAEYKALITFSDSHDPEIIAINSEPTIDKYSKYYDMDVDAWDDLSVNAQGETGVFKNGKYTLKAPSEDELVATLTGKPKYGNNYEKEIGKNIFGTVGNFVGLNEDGKEPRLTYKFYKGVSAGDEDLLQSGYSSKFTTKGLPNDTYTCIVIDETDKTTLDSIIISLTDNTPPTFAENAINIKKTNVINNGQEVVKLTVNAEDLDDSGNNEPNDRLLIEVLQGATKVVSYDEGKHPNTEYDVTITPNVPISVSVKDEAGNVSNHTFILMYMDDANLGPVFVDITPGLDEASGPNSGNYVFTVNAIVEDGFIIEEKDDLANTITVTFDVNGTTRKSGYAEWSEFNGKTSLNSDLEVAENGTVVITVSNGVSSVSSTFTITHWDNVKPELEDYYFFKNADGRYYIKLIGKDNEDQGIFYESLTQASTKTDEETFLIPCSGTYSYRLTDHAKNSTDVTLTLNIKDAMTAENMFTVSKDPNGNYYWYNNKKFVDGKGYKVKLALTNKARPHSYLYGIGEDVSITKFGSEQVFDMTMEGKFYASVQDRDVKLGEDEYLTFTQKLTIDNIDEIVPVIISDNDGKNVSIEAEDDLVGIRKVVVTRKDENGNSSATEYAGNGRILKTTLKDLDKKSTYTAYAVDNVGNKSPELDIWTPMDGDTIYHTVIFSDIDGTVLSKQKVEDGFSAVPPANPSHKSYHFIGWDKDYSNVNDDMIIMAKYNEKFRLYIDDLVEQILDFQTDNIRSSAIDLTKAPEPGKAYVKVMFFTDQSTATGAGHAELTDSEGNVYTIEANPDNEFEQVIMIKEGAFNIDSTTFTSENGGSIKCTVLDEDAKTEAWNDAPATVCVITGDVNAARVDEVKHIIKEKEIKVYDTDGNDKPYNKVAMAVGAPLMAVIIFLGLARRSRREEE